MGEQAREVQRLSFDTSADLSTTIVDMKALVVVVNAVVVAVVAVVGQLTMKWAKHQKRSRYSHFQTRGRQHYN